MIVALLLLGCFPRVEAPTTDTSIDPSPDTGDTDSGTDSGRDSGRDTGTDTGRDSGRDTGADSGQDSGEDTGSSDPACVPDLEVGARVGDAIATGTCVDDDAAGSCGNRSSPDAIVRWTAPTAGEWTLDTVGSASEDTVLYVLETDCREEIACDDDYFGGWSSVTLSMPAGASVLLGVEGGDWTLNAWQGECADANIGGELALEGDSTGADTDFTASCQPGYGADVVLRWVAPSTGNWRFSTEGSAYDTILVLNAGGCEGAEIGCGDDTDQPGDSSALWSTVTASLRAGDVVFVGIGGYMGDVGNWVLSVDRI